MGLLLASAVAGLLMLPLLPALPPFWFLPAFALACWLLWWRWRRHGLLCLCLFLGCFGWSVAAAERALSQRIPRAWEGVELSVQGRIDDLPEASALGGFRFRFQPETARVGEQDIALTYGRWQLFSPFPEAPVPDAVCTLSVKLKRPHGVANPGGFDYEAWLLSEKVTATGSVKSISCKITEGFSVDKLRFKLRKEFLRVYPQDASQVSPQVSAAGVLLALITGDRALIPDAVWERYVATGVVHLMAISGLHITLLAVVMAWLSLRLLRFFPSLALRCPLHKPALLLGFFLAFFYSLIAGFSVPTARTLIMLGVIVLAHWSERRLPSFQVLALALMAVLLWTPLAVHAAGFWLSFGAVAILLLLGSRHREQPLWQQALQMQFAMSLLLLPLTLWFFERASWVSPFANLIAVPLLSFVIVPLGLLGLLCWLLPFTGLAHFFWDLAIRLIMLMDVLLEKFQTWPAASTHLSLPGWATLFCLVLALLCLLQPLQTRLRWLSPLFLLPLFFPQAAFPPAVLRLTVLDVGQGLSVLVETGSHRLLYDTGPTLGLAADAGQRYVLPALHQRGVYTLNKLLLSHDDSDHIGGANSVLAGMTVGAGLGVRPTSLRPPPGMLWQDCRAGQHWQWDGWQFTVLYPTPEEMTAADKDNNRSCVLMIRRGLASVLLPGDLESPGERALLERFDASALQASVLVLGHHGSRTSTTQDFLAAVQPQWAIASAGYRHHFRHPSAVVLERLQSAGIPWRNTAASGAVTLLLSEDGKVQVQEFRQEAGRYWQN